MAKTGILHPLTTTHRDTGNGYKLLCRQYPTGDVELMALKFDHDTIFHKNLGDRSRKNTDKSAMDESTLKKSQARSRKTVRMKALTLQANNMLTLTFKDNVTDLDEAWSCLKYFIKLMRWKYKDRFQYIAVPEYQERGAVHFHLAVHGYYHANTVRWLWKRAVGKRGGNIDFSSARTKTGKIIKNPKKIAGYLSKYISKNDSVDFDKRRYSSSANLTPPEPVTEWLALGVPVGSVMASIIEDMTHHPITTHWESNKFIPIIFYST